RGGGSHGCRRARCGTNDGGRDHVGHASFLGVPPMLTHYLLIAVRNVERHRFTTIVAVAGLALGLACFIGARLFVSHIDGAERHFPNAERIYVVHQTSSWAPIGLEVPFGSSVTPLIAARLRSDYP